MEKNETNQETRNFRETLEYRLNYGNSIYTVYADEFDLALKQLSDHLRKEIKENQVRIATVVRVKVAV